MDDLKRNMAKGGRAGKAFDIANRHVAMPKAGVAGRQEAEFESDVVPVLACFASKCRAQKLTIGLRSKPDSGLFSN